MSTHLRSPCEQTAAIIDAPLAALGAYRLIIDDPFVSLQRFSLLYQKISLRPCEQLESDVEQIFLLHPLHQLLFEEERNFTLFFIILGPLDLIGADFLVETVFSSGEVGLRVFCCGFEKIQLGNGVAFSTRLPKPDLKPPPPPRRSGEGL